MGCFLGSLGRLLRASGRGFFGPLGASSTQAFPCPSPGRQGGGLGVGWVGWGRLKASRSALEEATVRGPGGDCEGSRGGRANLGHPQGREDNRASHVAAWAREPPFSTRWPREGARITAHRGARRAKFGDPGCSESSCLLPRPPSPLLRPPSSFLLHPFSILPRISIYTYIDHFHTNLSRS